MTGIINTNIMLHPLSSTRCSTCQALLQVLFDYQSTSGCQKFKLHTLNFNHQHVALQILYSSESFTITVPIYTTKYAWKCSIVTPKHLFSIITYLANLYCLIAT